MGRQTDRQRKKEENEKQFLATVHIPYTVISQSIFYFMSVHIEVTLDKNKKQKHVIIIYTNFPTGP